MSVLTRSVVASVLCAAVIAATSGARASAVRDLQTVSSDEVETLIANGRYDQAEIAAQSAVERLTRATGADSIETAAASDSFVRALTLNGKGSLPTTIALAERTLSIKEARAGPSRRELAASLINLGTALGEAAEHRRAIGLLQRAVALRQAEAVLPQAEALDALGVELVRASRYEDAVGSLQRSLSLKDVARDGDISLTITLNNLALALQQKGDYPSARIALQRALGLQKDRDIHPVQVTTLTLLGQQLWFEGSWAEARNASARSVDIAERTLRPDHPTTASALRYLAATLLDLGDIAAAKPLQERALGIVQRSLGPDHYENAPPLNALGDSTMLLGDYPAARTLFERALSIVEKKMGPDHVWAASVVHNLALIDARLGDYTSARQRQARAIAIWERVYGRDDQRISLALMQLASVDREQGAPGEALPLLERALAIRERKLGPNHRDVAGALADLSATLVQLRRPQRAQALATRALLILEGVEAADAPDLATVLDLYAQLQARQGDNQMARLYFDRALAIREKVFGPAHPAVAETQARLALTLARLDSTALAFTLARAAESTGREHLRLMLRYLPERQSLNYAATRPRGLDLILSLAGSMPDATVIGLDEVIRSRALVLDEMAKRRNSLSVSGEIGPLATDLTRARQRLVNLVVRGPGDLGPARYTAFVEEARRESERAERALAERNASFNSELQRTQVGLRDVQNALPVESALVSFIRYQRTNVTRASDTTGTAHAGPAAPVTSYLAFVLKPGEPPVAVPLGSVNAIDALVTNWRASITAEAATSTRGATPSSRSAGNRLRTLVWDPLAGPLNGAKEVFIVPDGALSLVPFAALPVRQSSYLIEEGPVIHYVSAERDLASFSTAPLRQAQGLFAIGGPAFDDQTSFGERINRARPTSGQPSSAFRSSTVECDSLQHMTFKSLDGSLREVQELAKLWTVPKPNDVRVLVGREASERTFKEEASRYRVLHLATHGFFLGDSCDSSPGTRGVRAVGGLATPARARANEVSRENPLLLSGLALAGANRRAAARPDEDDGILTAEEVASLNLTGVEWAVLSACGTGLGEIKAGEGVFGLRRAFQIAGARTVIMSLWSVDDQATRVWMRALYEDRFQKGLDTAHAMHAASLTVLHDRRAKGQSTLPFYWAAFVAAGDWR